MMQREDHILTYYNVMDSTISVEDNIKKIWKRNVFFILGFALLYIFVSIKAIINRICQIPRILKNWINETNVAYSRKISKYRFWEFINQLTDENIWKTFGCMLFFVTMFLCKFIYHVAKISYWIFNHIIKPLLWMLVILCSAKTIGDSIKSRNN